MIASPGLGLLVLLALEPPSGAEFAPYGRHSCIASIGDVDEDHVRDLIVAERDGVRPESVWVLSGKTGALLHVVRDEIERSGFGQSLADIGDVDRDGVTDFAVGAANGETSVPGTVYVWSGKTGTKLLEIAGTGASWLGFSVAAAGDVDGDAVPDVLAGDPQEWTAGGFKEVGRRGRCGVYSGKDGRPIRTITSPLVGTQLDEFGFAIAGLGDLDGDGRPDFAVSAPQTRTHGGSVGRDEGSGSVYVYSGKDGALLRTIRGSAPFGGRLASAPRSSDEQGWLAIATLSRKVQVLSLADWSVKLEPGSHAGKTYIDDFGSSIDFGRDPRTHRTTTLVVGANETWKEFFDEGYVELFPLDGSTELELVEGDPRYGFDACSLDDVNGDGVLDYAYVFVGIMGLRVVSGADAKPIYDVDIRTLALAK